MQSTQVAASGGQPVVNDSLKVPFAQYRSQIDDCSFWGGDWERANDRNVIVDQVGQLMNRDAGEMLGSTSRHADRRLNPLGTVYSMDLSGRLV